MDVSKNLMGGHGLQGTVQQKMGGYLSYNKVESRKANHSVNPMVERLPAVNQRRNLVGFSVDTNSVQLRSDAPVQ